MSEGAWANGVEVKVGFADKTAVLASYMKANFVTSDCAEAC
ncbi:MAG: hypothetical protein ABJN04_12565 [Hyphomicrobiales bacterium]